MKITNVTKCFFAAALLAAGLTACGSGTLSANTKERAYESAAADTAAYDSGMSMASPAAGAVETAAYDDVAEAAEEPVYEEGSSATEVPENAASERKLIKTVNISAETEKFDTLIPDLQGQVESLGGYIESISVYDINSYYVEEHLEKQRGADMTARVPKEKLDGFLARVGEQANVTSHSESVEDVTLQYVDLESHKKALLTEQERLIELLGEAESVEDIIAIEGRLSEVRYQLESMESQLRTYDNKIDYSTVYLYVTEVRKYTPSVDASVGEKIANGFVKSLEDIGYGIRDLAVGFVIDLPYIVLWIVIIAVIVLILRLVWKLWKKRAAKRWKDTGRTGAAHAKGRVQFRWPVTREHGESITAENEPRESKTAEEKTDAGQETGGK